MSSKGWDVDQQGSRKLMQAAKLSKHGVSSQPPELEESSQVETAKSGRLLSWYDIVPLLITSFFVVLVLGLMLVPSMFPLWTLEVLMLVLVLVLVEPVLMLALEKYRHPGTNYTHMHNKVSWDEIVLRLVPSIVVLVLWGLLIAQSIIPLVPLEVLMWMVPVLMLVLVLILGLKRYGHPHTNYTHMHNTLSKDDVVPWLVVGALVPTLGVAVAVLARMFPLWRMLLLVLLVVLVLLLTLERGMNFWRARKHRRGRLVKKKWGPHEWVLDSSAWIHRTSNPLVVLEGDHLQFQDQKVASLYVELGLRSLRTERFDIPGVRFVAGDDDDARNVVSVSQLARDHGLVTVFEPTSCHVKDKKTGQIVGKGRLHNGMYMLDYLRISIVRQYIGDGEASSGGEHADGGGGSRGHGGRGNNGDGRERGGQSRDGGGGGTGASRNQEQGDSESGAAGGDINDEEIVNEEEGGSGNEIQEMNDKNIDDGNGQIHHGINGNGEEEDKKRGGRSTIGESSNKAGTGLLGLSRVLVWCLCIIAACILLLQCTSRGTGVICKLATFNNNDFHSLLGFSLLLISSLELLRTLGIMQSISRKLVKQIGSLLPRSRDGEGKEEGTSGDYVQESSQQLNRQLFGLSRFDVTTDPTGYMLPAGAFPSSTNAARRDEFLVDSGASFHATWNGLILVSYPKDLKDHTEPPTRSFGGIIGSIMVTRSGYLSGDKIKLDGVLLAPESRMNLVSVGQLSIQYEVKVEMDDEGVIIKKKQDGVQIGGGNMLNNHQYVLEYFQPPEGLFARSPTPHFKIFGTRRPGPAHVNTVPCPTRSTTTEETGADSEETGAGRESRAVRMRRPNTLVTGPTWSR